jgi:hypothetical protein
LAVTGWADVTLNLETEISGSKQTTIMKVAEQGMRLEQAMGAVVILPQTHQMLMINPAQKTVMTMALPENLPGRSENATPPKITKTGKSDTINGFACEQYLVTLENGTVSELWISPDGPDLSAFAGLSKSLGSLKQKGSGPSFDWFEGVIRDKALARFPIRTMTSGVTSTLLSFNTTPLSADEFAAPAGYQTMTLPNLSGLSGLTRKPAGTGTTSGSDMMKQIQQLQKQSASGGEISPEQIKALQEAAEKMAPPQ